LPSEDSDEDGFDAHSVFFKSFSDLGSRSIDLIMTLSNNYDRFVDDTSLTREVLISTNVKESYDQTKPLRVIYLEWYLRLRTPACTRNTALH